MMKGFFPQRSSDLTIINMLTWISIKFVKPSHPKKQSICTNQLYMPRSHNSHCNNKNPPSSTKKALNWRWSELFVQQSTFFSQFRQIRLWICVFFNSSSYTALITYKKLTRYIQKRANAKRFQQSTQFIFLSFFFLVDMARNFLMPQS